MFERHDLTRRTILLAGAGTLAALAVGPSLAEEAETEAAIRAFTGGAPVTPGKVRLDVAPLVENGNSVALAVDVDHPMTAASHVTRIAVFNEKNPQPEVAVFHLGPRSGRAHVATRIRMATTQHLTAVAALSDGTFWSDKVEVIVTIAACTEE